MRIAIDGRNLQTAEGTGIATYSRSVLSAIRCAGLSSELLIAGDAPWSTRFGRYLAACRSSFWSGLADADAWDGLVGRLRESPDVFRCAQIHFDIRRRLLPVTGPDLPDIMHWTAPLPLRLAGVPNIYTFHDAIPLRRPNRTGTNAARYRRLLARIAATADHVIADTEATRREVVAAFPQLAERITVIPLAVEVPARVLAQAHAELDRIARERVGCGAGQFYLFCGTIEPRKNIPALIHAFRASGSTRRLALAGPDGWRAADELAGLLGDAVIRLGYIERDTLWSLMRAARALLYPSLAEGFGLPIIEAMALGTPVLTSAGGATAEVAGDAALLVDPTDPAALTAAIRRTDGDDTLIAGLGRRGRLRADCFSTAAQTSRLAAVYRAVIGAAAC